MKCKESCAQVKVDFAAFISVRFVDEGRVMFHNVH